MDVKNTLLYFTFLFRENRRHGTDGQTDGGGATLYAALQGWPHNKRIQDCCTCRVSTPSLCCTHVAQLGINHFVIGSVSAMVTAVYTMYSILGFDGSPWIWLRLKVLKAVSGLASK